MKKFEELFDLPENKNIPDPFVFLDGTAVATAQDWGRRAQEISDEYQYCMYGVWRDGSDEEVSYTINDNTMTITVKRKSTGAQASFDTIITRADPEAAKKFPAGSPVVVGMHGFIQEQVASAAGYAVIALNGFVSPIASDDTKREGAFYTLYPYGEATEEQTGVLMAWSWGTSKVLDALEAGAAKELNIDPTASIVTGVSRYGKAALVAGAFEPRFKMVAPSCSGAGGVAMYRYVSEGITYDFTEKGVENPYTYTKNEPLDCLQSDSERGWFNDNFLRFKTPESLPVDQHMLCSLVADKDRYLFIIGSCISEDWVNAPAMWLTYKATKPVYDFLGISDNIAVNMHKEGHAVVQEDMEYIIDYFNYHVYGIEPTLDLSRIQTSVFELEANKADIFTDFNKDWTIK